MRGDSQVELRGAVLVGRRVVPEGGSEADNGKLVTVKGLLLRIDSRGLTVEGPRPNVVHTVSWQRVRSIEAGNSAMFEDARPARSIQVELDDRRVQFLVPVEALGDHQMSVMDAIVAAHVASRPHEQRDVVNETLGAISQTGPSATAVRTPMKAPRQRGTGAGDPSPARVGSGLPPPPPSSGVVMPPEPQNAAGSGVPTPKENVVGPPRALQQAPPIDRELLQPRAVPSARRVKAPISGASEPSLPEPDSGRVLPRLPPPPPGGSRSMPPPPFAEQSRTDPTPAVEQGPRAEFVPRAPGVGVSAGAAVVAGSGGGVTDPKGERRGEGRNPRRKSGRHSRRTTVVGGVLLVAAAVVGGSLFGLVSHRQRERRRRRARSRSSRRRDPKRIWRITGDVFNALGRGGSQRDRLARSTSSRRACPPDGNPGRHHGPGRDRPIGRRSGRMSRIPRRIAGIVSGVTEHGGPKVESSRWFASPSGESAFESHVDLTQAASTEESDIAALKGSRA